jgi:glycosyltransferase involved in cell wall biosynthesis
MRLFVIENGLKSNGGHYLNNCLAIKNSAEKRSLSTTFLIHKQADPSIVNTFSGVPCISYSQFESVSKDPLSGNFESYLIQSSTIAKDLFQILSSEIRPCDIVFCPTASCNELGALDLLIGRIPQFRNTKFIFNFVVQNFLVPATLKANQKAGLYRLAANSLRSKLSQSQLLLTANGRDMTAALSSILNLRVFQYPIPKHYPERLIRELGNNNPRPLIGVFGSMYGPQKGLHFLPVLVEAIQGVDWLIQEPNPDRESLWGVDPTAIRSRRNVSLIAHGLDPEKYYNHFNSVDIVLTPYEIKVDKLNSSGIVAEAAASGKIIVSPANSWVREHMQNGMIIGSVYLEWKAESIKDAIDKVLQNMSELRHKAAVAAVQWRETQNADAYLDRALDYYADKTGEKL